jgi:hypothetical protein
MRSSKLMASAASVPLHFAAVVAVALLISFTIGDRAQAATCNTLLDTTTLFIGAGPACSTSGEQKIFLEKGIGTTVSGNIGSHKGTPIADFTSSSSSLRAAGGFATIRPNKPGTNVFDDMTISIEPTGTSTFRFGALTFGLQLARSNSTSLTIEALDSSNASLGTLTLTNSELRQAMNTKFLVMANSTDLIASVLLESSGIRQIKQFNIADIVDPPVAPTPLPAALPLFATGLGMLGLLGWRRKRKAQATA